jgi:hypothetical protein
MAYPHDKRDSPKPLAWHVRCGVSSYKMLKNSSSPPGVFGSKNERNQTNQLPGQSSIAPNLQAIGILAVRKWFSRSLLDMSKAISIMFVVALLAACGEPMFENAGSPNSLLEDREACVMDIDQSPAALAYRKNPAEHPEYPNQVFEEMNQCIERKGWKQVRSQQEQERVREATRSELAHSSQPAALSDTKAREALARAVEDRLAH